MAYIGPFGKVSGRLIVTRFRMVFMIDENGKQCEVRFLLILVWSMKSSQHWKLDVPLGHISRIDKVGGKSTSSAMRGDDNYGLIVYCKDLRAYRFVCLPTPNGRKNICDALNRYSFPVTHNFVSHFRKLSNLSVCACFSRYSLLFTLQNHPDL